MHCSFVIIIFFHVIYISSKTYQQGGIERYLKTFPDGGHWRGKNFVFDKRGGVGIGTGPEGDGGVIVNKKDDTKNKKKQSKKGVAAVEVVGDGNGASATGTGNNNDKCNTSQPLSKCCVCGTGWDRYVGKKKCYTCG